jgi:dihydrofolate reductase/thymidylate synthase
MLLVNFIVSIDDNNRIGYNNELLYDIKEDKQYFNYITKGCADKQNIVLMGRNTWDSIPTKHRPLKDRVNVVFSNANVHHFTNSGEVTVVKNLDDFIKHVAIKYNEIFIIGGALMYESCINHKDINIQKIYITKVKCNSTEQIKLDITKIKIFPNIDLNEYYLSSEYKIITNNYKSILYNNTKDSLYCTFKIYTKNINDTMITYNDLYKSFKYSNEDEYHYLKLMSNILNNGNIRKTRNAITKSLFGEQLSFNLKKNFPLLTTKKMFLRGIFEELSWFIKGHTNSKILENKKVNIWKGNTSQTFINKTNLPYNEGDIGNMYGFQLRHSGEKYKDCNTDYTGKGFDQIEYCLNLLKTDKYSRRIIMTTFIPHEAQFGVLYPCHGITIQFYVKEINEINYLTCHMYQRSADMFLGVPFNITSYSLFVYLICEILNNENYVFTPDRLIISFGDIHIYEEHFENAKNQIKRIPFNFPQLSLKNKKNKLENFIWEDLEVTNYNSYNSIKATMIS